MTRGAGQGHGAQRLRSVLQRASLAGVGGVLVAFLVAPVAALLLGTSWAEFVAGLAHPLVWPALRLSLLTSSASLACAVLLGTPLAWALSLSERRWARFIETLVELPIVIPPAVAGIALLLAFGRRGLFAVFYPPGWSLGFTTGAVVLAQLFVSAPFFVQAALSAFRRLDPGLGIVARTLGASPFRVFFRVAIPLGAPGLVAGALLAWARALGEFGATLMFAGNLEGKTQTLPLAIYTAFEADLRAAQALSIVLVAVATLLFWGVRTLGARRRGA